MLENYVKRLVECEDPIEEVWKILVDLWKLNADINAYFRQEERASEFENMLNNTFFEIYGYLYKRITLTLPTFQAPLIIVDGLSIREGNLLLKDLEKSGYEVTEYGYAFSSLPSTTQRFRSLFNVKYIEIRSGKIPSEIDFSKPIWISFPDEILHHAEFVQPPEAYERTKNVLFKVLKMLNHTVVTITSDHGYIMTDYVWPLAGSDRKIMKEKVFGSNRYAEISKIDEKVLERLKELPPDVSYLFMDNQFCYVRGRYFWPISGYGRAVAHGGLSLMECIVPKFKVKI